jgi:hypothetical protein
MASKDLKEPPADAVAEEKAAPAAQTAPAAQLPDPEKKTPAEWASQLGDHRPRDARLPQSTDHVSPAYAVADRLYGWSQHAYNFQAEGEAFLVTRATYQAALRTAPQFPAVELTADALTPEAALLLKDHKPSRNLKAERAAEAAKADAKVS